ncbi:MAG: hypothetical protein J0L92_06990 [Deltaproteobacteria bacterium]|nr:hypothetical protein [Deltaproteobacteria bacterium]
MRLLGSPLIERTRSSSRSWVSGAGSSREAGWTSRIALILGIAILASACAVTEADIEAWKTTVRGPGKIVAVLLADKYSDPLRVRAGLALVEMDRADVEGISELQGALRQMPDETRRRIVDGMAPSLIEMMQGRGAAAGAPAQGTGPDTGPAAIQVRAKDAAFVVLQFSSPPIQAQLTDAVVGWFVEDFNGRSLAGSFSAEQVIRQLGAPAASRLVEAMNARLPQQALTKICELISQLGDEPTKQRAGARIVEIEIEMESAEFGTWLGDRLRQQAAAAVPPRTLTDEQVARGVAFNREQFITTGALPAMHHLADQPPVAARLLVVAQQPSTTPELETRRVTALQALEGHVQPGQTTPLLALALDATQPDRVRDYAFDRIADSRDRSVLPQLWPIATQPSATSATAWRARWRVGTLLLSLGGAEVVAEWLTRLPRGTGEAYAREELHGYAERLAQVRPAPTDLMRARLTSSLWFEQALALYYFERVGTEADLAALQPLTTSTVATVGEHWNEHGTIGAIATGAISAIRERVSTPAAAAPAAPAPAAGAPAAP